MNTSKDVITGFTPEDFCVIYNPFSGGRSKAQILQTIEDELKPARCFFQHTSVECGAQKAVDHAHAAGIHQFIVVGGDGTIQAVATHLEPEKDILGLVMAGSGNGFASHFGYRRRLPQNLKLIRQKRLQIVDLLRVNGHRFVNLAGVGFDAQVADQIRSSKRRGFQVYFRAVLRLIWTKIFWSGKVYLDEDRLIGQFLTVVVANASIFGYGFRIARDAKADDGLMTVVLVHRVSRWRYVLAIPYFLLGLTNRLSWITERTAKQVIIEPDILTPLQADGELMELATRYDFQIEPRSLTLITA